MILNLPIKVRKDLCFPDDDFGVSSCLLVIYFSSFSFSILLSMYSYLHVLFSMEFNVVSSPILFRSSRFFFPLRFVFPCCIFNFRHERLRNFTSTNTLSCYRDYIFNAQYTAARRSHDHSFFSSAFTSRDLIFIFVPSFALVLSSSHPYVSCVSGPTLVAGIP